MSYDNRVFNVNGCEDEQLLAALKLAFEQRREGQTCKGWIFDKDKGLIFLWFCEDKEKQSFKLPSKLTAEQCFPLVLGWLNSEMAGQMRYEEWDADADHDGSNSRGWRVYCEDWGHVGGNPYAICAVRPAFLWHGK